MCMHTRLPTEAVFWQDFLLPLDDSLGEGLLELHKHLVILGWK